MLFRSYVNFVDSFDKPVYAVDNDRNSANFGKTSTTEIVKVIKRDHAGNPIHEAKKDASGNILYLGYDTVDGKKTEIEVLESDAKAVKEVASECWISPLNNVEYHLRSVDTVNGLAYWDNLDSNTQVTGYLNVDGTVMTASPSLTTLPTVHYSSANNTSYFNVLTPIKNKVSYTSPEYKVFKQNLFSYFNQNFNQVMDDNNYTADDAFYEIVESAYARYLYVVEAEAEILAGNAVWDVTEQNNIDKYVYTQIDTKLEELFSEISTEFGKIFPNVSTEEPSTETTYPTQSQEEQETVRDTVEIGRAHV